MNKIKILCLTTLLIIFTGDKSMLMIAGLVILAGLSLYLIKTE